MFAVGAIVIGDGPAAPIGHRGNQDRRCGVFRSWMLTSRRRSSISVM
jgi:hypothetical protein